MWVEQTGNGFISCPPDTPDQVFVLCEQLMWPLWAHLMTRKISKFTRKDLSSNYTLVYDYTFQLFSSVICIRNVSYDDEGLYDKEST